MTPVIISNSIIQLGNKDIADRLMTFLNSKLTTVTSLQCELWWGYIHKSSHFTSVNIQYDQPQSAILAGRYVELEAILRVICEAYLAGSWIG